MNEVDKFLKKLEAKELNWLKSEIKKPELNFEGKEILDVIIPVITKIFVEIKERLDDRKFTKKELSEMYFQEMNILTLITQNLEEKLMRGLSIDEKQLISEITKYYENLLVEIWIKY